MSNMRIFKSSDFACALILLLAPLLTHAEIGTQPQDYRNLVLQVRDKAEFEIPIPLNPVRFTYQFDWNSPLWPKPLMNDFHWDPSKPKEFSRSFFDKIFVKDGSFLQIGSEKLPVTCVFIDGQDNRFSGITTPTLPEFVLKVYVVTNDFACAGPINQGFPTTGGKPELWDTYVYFIVRDPTIMLPMDVKLRYRWNEYQAVLIDSGK